MSVIERDHFIPSLVDRSLRPSLISQASRRTNNRQLPAFYRRPFDVEVTGEISKPLSFISLADRAAVFEVRRGNRLKLHDTLFKNFAPFEFMKLMRVGRWLEAKQGETLATEKKPSVMLIYNGLVGVETNGKEVAKLKDGNFIW